MQNRFKKTLNATLFAMLVALPFGIQAADSATATASAPTIVKEALRTITSTPKGIDGELIRAASASPINTHETTVAACRLFCAGGDCWWVCW